jgi:hypothetical protein
MQRRIAVIGDDITGLVSAKRMWKLERRLGDVDRRVLGAHAAGGVTNRHNGDGNWFGAV